jgi:hypothetical protein
MHQADPVPEPAAQPFNNLVNRMAAMACVTAVLNKRQLGVRDAQHVVACQINGRVERVRDLMHESLTLIVTGRPSSWRCLFRR